MTPYELSNGRLTAKNAITGIAVIRRSVALSLIDVNSEQPRVPFTAIGSRFFSLGAGQWLDGEYVLAVISWCLKSKI